MPKGVPNKRYTPEFKKLVIEVMMEEKLDEMIEALTFSRSEISGSSGGGISDKTLHIALNYEDRMNRLNDGALSEIAYQLYDLERQQERLLYVCTIMLQLQIERFTLCENDLSGRGRTASEEVS